MSSYAIEKCVGHLPGPYTIPHVYADVYCVYTNRTPATAMRGFGITGVDYAVESHLDVVAHELGLNPIALRIMNAYRDGDMKAHRRVAKNCALIECCQVAAEKAGVTLAPLLLAMASMKGGGEGARGQIPNYTALDEHGRVEGFARQSYGGGEKTTPMDEFIRPTPPPTPTPQPARVADPVRAAGPAAAPAAPAAASPTPSPQRPLEPAGAPPAAPPDERKRAPRRFSSVSGMRRR